MIHIFMTLNSRREEALRLLKQVKDPRTVKSKKNFTLLHCAPYHGWLDVVKQLINDHHHLDYTDDNVVLYLRTGECVMYIIYVYNYT